MRRKELKQKSLFDPAPAADQVEPTTGEDAKGEGIEVAVNDFAIDAGEPIRSVAVETKVGDDTVLTEVLPAYADSYQIQGATVDVAVVARLTVSTSKGMKRFGIIRHMSGRAIGQYELVELGESIV